MSFNGYQNSCQFFFYLVFVKSYLCLWVIQSITAANTLYTTPINVLGCGSSVFAAVI